jgi:hypothetical protein
MPVLRVLALVLGCGLSLVLILAILVLGSPFWVVASIMRALLAMLASKRDRVPADVFATFEKVAVYEPQVGWRMKPSLDTWGRVADDVYHFTTDPEGWRGVLPLDDSEVVVLGDSFAFGQGVDDKRFYAHRCEGIPVKAVAAIAYNMVQELIWLRRLANRLAGKLVVWFVYQGNDLYENLQPNVMQYRAPYLLDRTGGWSIEHGHVSRDPWPFERSFRDYDRLLAEICTPGALADRAYAASSYLVQQAAECCEDVEASLVVVSIPAPIQVRDPSALEKLSPRPEIFDAALPDRRLQEACRGNGLPFVALRGTLTGRDFHRVDVHLSPRGHAKVGKVLAQVYRDHGVPNS